MAGTDKTIFFSNAVAGTSTPKMSWKGGWLAFIASATWSGGSAKLQFLGPDGTTYIDVPSGSLSANGMLMLNLPAGIYQAVTATGSAFYVIALGIPTNVNR